MLLNLLVIFILSAPSQKERTTFKIEIYIISYGLTHGLVKPPGEISPTGLCLNLKLKFTLKKILMTNVSCVSYVELNFELFRLFRLHSIA